MVKKRFSYGDIYGSLFAICFAIFFIGVSFSIIMEGAPMILFAALPIIIIIVSAKTLTNGIALNKALKKGYDGEGYVVDKYDRHNKNGSSYYIVFSYTDEKGDNYEQIVRLSRGKYEIIDMQSYIPIKILGRRAAFDQASYLINR